MKNKQNNNFHNLLEYYEFVRDSQKKMMILLVPVLTIMAVVIFILWPQLWWIGAMLIFLDACIVIGWINAIRLVKREKKE